MPADDEFNALPSPPFVRNYYSAPKAAKYMSLEDVDPEILAVLAYPEPAHDRDTLAARRPTVTSSAATQPSTTRR